MSRQPSGCAPVNGQTSWEGAVEAVIGTGTIAAPKAQCAAQAAEDIEAPWPVPLLPRQAMIMAKLIGDGISASAAADSPRLRAPGTLPSAAGHATSAKANKSTARD